MLTVQFVSYGVEHLVWALRVGVPARIIRAQSNNPLIFSGNVALER
jgi:hypothetical protein